MVSSDQLAGLSDHQMTFRVVSCSRIGWVRRLLCHQRCHCRLSQRLMSRAFPYGEFDEVESGDLDWLET
jgi:hypothetical protein